MFINKRAYDIDKYVTEIYDLTETQTEDVELIKKLIGSRNCPESSRAIFWARFKGGQS